MIHEVEKFKAAGEETRLRILRVLVKAETELCVCEIIDVLKKPQYNISKHLGILKRAGLLRERRDGRMMMYGLIMNNKINRNIFKAVGSVKSSSDPLFAEDYKLLTKRLNKRMNGKCVVGKC